MQGKYETNSMQAELFFNTNICTGIEKTMELLYNSIWALNGND